MSAAEPAPRPAGAEQLRRTNTALVLRALRDGGPTSRAGLAKSTGLAKATVSTIVTALTVAGAVGERDAVVPARGRPSRPVHLDGAHLVGLGIEVNVDYIALVALDLAGRTVAFDERPAPVRDRVDLDGVSDFVQRSHDDLVAAGHCVLGVTVAVPGLVDRDRGRVRSAPNLGWSDVDLAGRLGAVTGPGCPVRVDNDANCAALAEVSRGVAVGQRHVVYLTGTVGLGAGIVSEGRVLRGASGYAGEAGHVDVGVEAVCGCGRTGCLEAAVGLHAIARSVGLSPEDVRGDPLQVADAIAARARSHEAAREGLAGVARRLATGAVVLANVLDPSMIVLGGSFEPLGPWLLPPVRAALEREVFAPGRCAVEVSTLGLHAASIGGATEVLGEVYDGRLALPT